MRSHEPFNASTSKETSPPPASAPRPPQPKPRRASPVVSDRGKSVFSPVARSSTPTIPSRATPPRITATATPTRLHRPTLSSSLRTPLRQRDHNVPGPVSTTRPAAKATTMPFDKGSSTTTRQPALPQLSAAAAKAMGRAPLTPKIATKAPPVVTPLGRRRNDNANNYSAGVNGGKEDITSPVSNFLGHNITPRSGSRQIRVDSTSSTPNGTPNPDRSGDWDNRSGLGISAPGFDGEQLRKQVVTFSPPSDLGSRQDSPDTKFFYASEAKSVPLPPQPRPLSTQPRASTFLYAKGGGPVERNRPTSPAVAGPPPILAAPVDNQSSKFFYANGTPDLQPAFKPSFTPSGPGSTVSSASKLVTGRPGATTPGGGYAMAPRPASPNKQPSIQSLKGGLPPPSRSQISSAPPLGASVVGRRRISIDTSSQPVTRSRTGSITSADAIIMSKFMASQTSSEASSPSAPPNPAMTMASIIQAAEDFAESEESKADVAQPEVQSPTKSTNSSDPLNDLVMNARRERKVQDLEITNASLEAINRSLERQLRKQTAELRRYRRLSRSGRFSLVSVASSRVPSDSIAGASGVEGLDLSDLSEEEDEPEDEEDVDSESEYDSASASSSMSLSTKATRDARRRKKDEQRLQLDLSQHRQLLVDSQKINQSIKRCMNWTEELIKEGKKALAYTVRVSDVELGGRVLAPPDEEDEHQREERIHKLGVETPLCLAAPWGKEPQDRDSGIELPVDGG